MSLLAPVISFNLSDFSISGSGGGVNTSDSTYKYGYAVYKRPVGGGTLTLLTKVYTDASTFSLSLYGLVTAVCEITAEQFEEFNGSPYAGSGFSNYVVITLPPPRPPSTLSYDAITNTLSWSGASGGIASYKVYKANGSTWSLIATVTTTATSGSLVLDTYLTTSADLMVRTVDSGGSISTDSEIVHVAIEDTLVPSSYTIYSAISISFDTLREIKAVDQIVLDTLREVISDPHVTVYLDAMREVRAQELVFFDTLREVTKWDTVYFDTLREVRFSIESMLGFIGQLSPGDVLIIDLKDMTATLNGLNAVDKISGEFFSLLPGANFIKYQDTAASRNLAVEITKRTKLL